MIRIHEKGMRGDSANSTSDAVTILVDQLGWCVADNNGCTNIREFSVQDGMLEQ